MKDLEGGTTWELLMLERRRKTLAVCPKCHSEIHPQIISASNKINGEPYTPKGVRTVREGERRQFTVVRLDLSDIRKMVQLLSNDTSNLNQIAKRANETLSIYESDIRDLQAHYEKLWEHAEAILRGLMKLK